MYLDSNDRRGQIPPQLAMRVAIIGGIALVAFGVIFFRLWYLQVLSGDKYEAEARSNQVRSIKVQAPRGEIVDREGRVLVANRSSLAVKVSPDKIPDDDGEREELYGRLARVLGMDTGRIGRSVERQLKAVPFGEATVKQDVSRPVVAYLLENGEDFPGIGVEQVFLRSYPHGEVGAHLFGYVGEATEAQLEDELNGGVELGDRIGQAGIELQYDNFLRGENGASRLQVDAAGTLQKPLAEKGAVQGRQLRLSLDLDVQRAAQRAMGGAAGGFVAMNVRNGQVLALGSSPSFDPNLFSKAISTRDYKELVAEENGSPLANRAVQGLYPTGSVYKLVTAVAALEGGLISPEEVVYDGGSITVGGVTFKNAGDAVHGAVALRQALSVSSDVYFYLLGREADSSGDGLLIQRWSRKLGVGRETGIDLPEELGGLIPTPQYRNHGFAEYQACVEKKQPTPEQISLGECGFLDRPWSVGDNINLAVGQGDLQANPLQMAVAYAAIANGGKVLQPRLGRQIEDADGRVRQELRPPEARKVAISAEHRQAIMEGLRSAASEPGGTSQAVFAGFQVPVAGKTGTAEKGAGRADQSWYCGLAPYPDPRYVACTTFEQGGFGADTAAPAVREILAEIFSVEPGDPALAVGATD